MEAPLLASLFELGGELGTAVDLHRPDRKGHAELQGVEELSGGLSCGAGVRLQHVPAGNHVAGGELFKDHARRSEERRVGKECRCRWSAYHEKKKQSRDADE